MAMFSAGAGKIGNYDQCCFEYVGIGQFRPLEGSSPHLGIHNQLEFVKEYKIEMIVEASKIKAVVKSMKEAHPYEEVAYQIFKCEDI